MTFARRHHVLLSVLPLLLLLRIVSSAPSSIVAHNLHLESTGARHLTNGLDQDYQDYYNKGLQTAQSVGETSPGMEIDESEDNDDGEELPRDDEMKMGKHSRSKSIKRSKKKTKSAKKPKEDDDKESNSGSNDKSAKRSKKSGKSSKSKSGKSYKASATPSLSPSRPIMVSIQPDLTMNMFGIPQMTESEVHIFEVKTALYMQDFYNNQNLFTDSGGVDPSSVFDVTANVQVTDQYLGGGSNGNYDKRSIAGRIRPRNLQNNNPLIVKYNAELFYRTSDPNLNPQSLVTDPFATDEAREVFVNQYLKTDGEFSNLSGVSGVELPPEDDTPTISPTFAPTIDLDEDVDIFVNTSFHLALVQDFLLNITENDIDEMSETTLKYLYDNIGGEAKFTPQRLAINEIATETQISVGSDGKQDFIETIVFKMNAVFSLKASFVQWLEEGQVGDDDEVVDDGGEDRQLYNFGDRNLAKAKCSAKDYCGCCLNGAINKNADSKACKAVGCTNKRCRKKPPKKRRVLTDIIRVHDNNYQSNRELEIDDNLWGLNFLDVLRQYTTNFEPDVTKTILNATDTNSVATCSSSRYATNGTAFACDIYESNDCVDNEDIEVNPDDQVCTSSKPSSSPSVSLAPSISSMPTTSSRPSRIALFPTPSPFGKPTTVPPSPTYHPTICAQIVPEKIQNLFNTTCSGELCSFHSVAIDGNTTVTSRNGQSIRFMTKNQTRFQVTSIANISYIPYSIALNANIAAVGSPFESTSSETNGAVYLYKKNVSGNWIQADRIVPSVYIQYQTFARWVDVYQSWMVVASEVSGGGNECYVYQLTGGSWVEKMRLIPNSNPDDQTLVWPTASIQAGVIAVGDNHYYGSTLGAIYLYDYNSSNDSWEMRNQYITNDECDAEFGEFMTLTWNGTHDGLLVSCRRQNSNAGAVYYYEESGGQFILRQKIVASDGQTNDFFGHFSKESLGNRTVAIGTGSSSNGVVYLFKYKNSSWEEIAKIESPLSSGNDYFGSMTAVETFGARSDVIISSTADSHYYTVDGTC